MEKKIELMSPAGSSESLMAAIQGGADAVYFGIEQLNMRARSTNNFTIDDLKEITKICSGKKVKTYLTLNTIIYDHDVSLMKKIVAAAVEAKVSAIIAGDHAVLSHCKKNGMPVHISTQANVSNYESVEFYSAYADAVVLARELTLKQVSGIVKEIKKNDLRGASGELMKVEIFGHGALCMAVSGKCYMSLHSDFASANRGACVQNCRRSYIVKDKETETEFEIDNEYIMSAADLCTIDFLDEVIDSGISILKIEGRGRSSDYVYTTTQCYREAIDAYYKGEFKASKVALWKERLSTVFNRGFWDGYYLGKKMGEWSNSYGSKATRRKIFLGSNLKYYEKVQVAEFKLESNSLNLGEEILITGPATGVLYLNAESLRVNDRAVNKVNKGETFTIPVSQKLRRSDKLYKLVNSQ